MCCEELGFHRNLPTEQLRLRLFPYVLNAGRIEVYGSPSSHDFSALPDIKASAMFIQRTCVELDDFTLLFGQWYTKG